MTPYLYRTFEFVDATHNMAGIELRIAFKYRHGFPAQIYGDPSNCYPAEGPEREYIRAEREISTNKWVPIDDREWLGEWCIASFEAADDDDLIRELPEFEREYEDE